MTDTLVVYLSGDAWDGDALATIYVNGVQVAANLDVAAVNSAGQVQAFTLTGNFGASPTVGVQFTNDAYSPGVGDRNLYLWGFNYDGVMQLADQAALLYDSTVSYTLTSTPATAERASDFVDSLGVNVHLQDTSNAYGNISLIQSDLNYLGIHNLRDGIPTSVSLPAMQALAADGNKFDLIMPDASSNTLLSQQLASADAIASSVIAIEGPNEVNLATSQFSWNGSSSPSSADAYQAALWSAVKADPNLAAAAVYNFSLGGATSALVQSYGNPSAYSNDGNIHVYYPNGLSPMGVVQYNVGMAAASNSTEPLVMTETNYFTAPALGGVSNSVQASYVLDMLMDASKLGIAQTYIYELFDDAADPNQTNSEDHFGLFNSDGTPKPAATAIHNLTTILDDTANNASSFTTGSLSYSVSGLPIGGDTLLLEKASGAYDLAVWAEPAIWNPTTETAVTAPSVPVQVSLGITAASVFVYDPLVGTAPIAQYANVSSVALTITDHPLILEITPSATASAGLPASVTSAVAGQATNTATATATAGSNGSSQLPNGGAGGNAAATASSTITAPTGNATATATATGGAGGLGYGTGFSGAGGSATASATSVAGNKATAIATTTATATGGAGGGAVTGTASMSTGYVAGAVTTTTGGKGTASVGSANAGAGGVASGSTSSAFGTASGSARVTQKGGAGGDATGSAAAGAGAASVLTNAVSGASSNGSVTLVQDTLGGGGGMAASGTGGTAGAATSSLTFDETKNATTGKSLTVFVDAYGGTGGSGPVRGVGGAATASDTLTGAATVTATTLATAGSGGVTGGNASAISSVTGSAVTATATANAGVGQIGNQNAYASQQANASGGSITASSSDTFKSTNLVLSESTTASTPVQGVSTAITSASAGAASSWVTADAEAIINAIPSSSAVTSALAAAPNTNAIFISSATVIAMGELGGGHTASGTGAETSTSTMNITFNRSGLSAANLFLGFYNDAAAGSSGISDINVAISAAGTSLLAQDFPSVSNAVAWFSDHPLNLGSLGSGTLAASSTVALQVTLAVTSSNASSDFQTGFILGASTA